MTRQALVFEASYNPDDEPIPIQFKFTNIKTSETVTHEFHALAEPGARAEFAVVSTARIDERGKRRIDLNGIKTFYRAVLVPGDYERLEDLLDGEDFGVPLEMLSRCMNELTSVYAGYPTVPSSASSRSQSENGERSTAGAS